MNTILKQNDIILFQGDSITDCHRNKLSTDNLGSGYVNLINHYIQSTLSTLSITCYNKGIAGDRAINLKQRWKRSTLDLSPDVLSILIGINDTWKRYSHNLIVSEDDFYINYRFLLEKTLLANPNTRIVLMSPFLIPLSEHQIEWFEDLIPKIDIVKKLSKEFNTRYIPLQDIFNEHLHSTLNPNDLTLDGIHPTPLGHALISKEWIRCISM